MTIRLYRNLSERNFVDKTLEELGVIEGTLREATSIIDPSFTIDSGSGILAVNYIYVEEFARYYFVNNIISTRNLLWELVCHVDVLSTYKNQIRNLSAIVARQEKVYNLYLDDDKFLVDSKRMYYTKAFPGRAPEGKSGNSFILSLAGGMETEESESSS